MTDVRPWTYAALFGALWGALEATVGTALHLGQVPFRGSLIGLAGLLCLVCLRRLQPRPGVCLMAGGVAVVLKIFTLGGLNPGPIVGIAVQAVAVEAAMTLTGGRVFGAAVGGFVTLATNPIQSLVTAWVVAGTDAVRASLELLQASAAAVGAGGVRPELVFGALVALTGAVGAAGGVWSWRLSGRVVRRLGRPR
jgi:hypothetical protein